MCARCGAQNPDGTLYCMNCGTPLTAGTSAVATAAPAGPPPVAPPGPPPGIAPPMAAPAGYQSPYYMPSGPVAPMHRIPWMLIIAGVVALVVLMAGCGTALAILGNRNSTNTTGAGDLSSPDVSSPSPGGTPSPVGSPTAAASGATTESNDGLTIPLPAGWTVANKDSEAIVLTDPNGAGSVTAASGQSSPVQTAQQNKATVDTYFKDNYPDARSCPGTSATNGTFNSVHGVSWTLCFTLTAGGHSVPAAASLFAGANSSGSVYYIVMLVTRQDNLKAYVAAAQPVLQGIHWKLS
jgi:hypothetical protein